MKPYTKNLNRVLPPFTIKFNKVLKQLYISMVLVATVMAGLYSCSPQNADKKRIPNLIETYKPYDTRPFGGYTAYHLLQTMYPASKVNTEKETIREAWRKNYDTGALYVAVAESFFTSEEDVTAIRNYVKAGNDMLVVASEFDDNLLDEIGCSLNSMSTFQLLLQSPMTNTSVRLNTVHYDDTSSYGFFYRPMTNYFSHLPKGESVVLGYNEAGRPNFAVIFMGHGKLFLHCEPKTFSNYFLLQKNNYQYFRQTFAYTRDYPEKIVWNDYYNNIHSPRSRKDDQSGSLFDGLKGGLLAAFWMLLALIVLYIIDGTKRRQRTIPIRKPNENTTVAFAETVGLLYLQKKDNKNIAEKMITYFNEFVRNQYFLNTSNNNQDFVTTLSRKSGVPLDKVEALYRTIGHAQAASVIDDYQLLSLSQQIQNFYKYRN